MRLSLPALVHGSVLIIASAAHAETILTNDNAKELCVVQEETDRYVDPHVLAEKIVAEARISHGFLDIANDTGTRDGAVTAREIYYALSNPNAPFGPNVNYREDPLKDLRQRLNTIKSETLNPLLQVGGSGIVGGYTRVPQGSLLAPSASDFFGPAPKLRIRCDHVTLVPATGSPERPAPSLLQSFRLRKDTKDLFRDNLAESGFFEASLDDDRRGDNGKKVSIVGTAGYVPTDSADFNDIGVFVAIDWTEYSKDDKTDVRAINPGFSAQIGRLKPLGNDGGLRLDLQADASYVFDVEQNSRKGVLSAHLDPIIDTPLGLLFGSALYRAPGPILLRPELSFLAESSWIFASGDSTELGNADGYVGFGLDSSLEARLWDVRPLQNFSVMAKLRTMRFVIGSIDIDSVLRYGTSLIYSPQDADYFSASLSWEKGENQLTFQQEDFIRLGVGLRY